MLNTIKAVLRFYGSVIRKYSPIRSGDHSIEDILNFVSYSDTLSSSGQPTEQQLQLIRDAGYSLVINLAPYDFIENPLKNEEAIVRDLGMDYIHIPVNAFKPKKKDFDRFVQTIKSTPGKKVWVHCAINMRASAFVYKYRCSILGEDKNAAIWDLREIWEPFGVWKEFVFEADPPRGSMPLPTPE